MRVAFFRVWYTGIYQNKCSLFVAIDHNVQFSEIFQKTIFCDFVNDRAAISRELVSFSYEAFCTDCDKNFKAEDKVFVNYVSVSDLITQNMTSNSWFEYIMKRTGPTTSSCPWYDRISNIRSRSNELSKFSLNLRPGLISVYRFQNEKIYLKLNIN